MLCHAIVVQRIDVINAITTDLELFRAKHVNAWVLQVKVSRTFAQVELLQYNI